MPTGIPDFLFIYLVFCTILTVFGQCLFENPKKCVIFVAKNLHKGIVPFCLLLKITKI